MGKNKKEYTLNEIIEETKQNDPKQYDNILQREKIKSDLIQEYKKTAHIPEFKTPEEYHVWQSTPEGIKHLNDIQKINKQTDKEFKKQHGGARQGAGRKKASINKVKFTPAIPEETRKILKEFSLSKGIPENEILNTLILYGCKPDSPLFDS